MRLVRAILMGAINANTSDIHLEPHEPEMRVRYRVDGELQPVMTIPNHIEDAVVARIKVMACHTHVAEIEPQSKLWRRHTGAYPAADLSDVGGHPAYFPEGLPVCPVDGTGYTIDTTSGIVLGHEH